jgi:hypothetical protein
LDTSHTQREKSIRYWPLWIPRALLLIYILGLFLNTVIHYTFVEELSPRFWDFGPSIYQMISMAILLLIAWFKPFIGGILTLSASIIIIILAFLAVWSGDGGVYLGSWLIGWGIPLAIPGLLFLIFGRIRTKSKNE